MKFLVIFALTSFYVDTKNSKSNIIIKIDFTAFLHTIKENITKMHCIYLHEFTYIH